MLSAEVEYSIQTLYGDARKRRFEFITVEHLLLVLLDNPSAAEALRACAADIPQLRQELEAFISENTPLIPEQEQRDVQPTLGFQRVIHRAVYSAQTARKGEVTGDAVLVAIFGEPDSHAVYFLSRHRVTRLDVINFIAHGIRKDYQPESPSGRGNDDDGQASHSPQQESETEASESGKPLERFARNLNDLALEGKIDPLIGRDHEIERTIQILCRRRKNNPLLVGEAGVGKTADRKSVV